MGMIRRLVMFSAAAAIALTLAIGGCGSNEETAIAEIQQPPVDPRFASVEAFIEYFNDIAAARDMRCAEIAPLIYAETEFQRGWSEYLHLVARSEELEDLTLQRFNAPLNPEYDNRIQLGFGPMILVKSDHERAEAALTRTSSQGFGKVMLVKVNGRWWISGYTWEYAMQPATREGLPRKMLTFQVAASTASTITPRLRAGEFSTIEQVRAAHREELLAYFKQNPDIYKQITGKRFQPDL